VPEDATKESHPVIREQFKACALGVIYGLGALGLAERAGVLPIVARRLLQLHLEIYHVFWSWSDRVVATANTHLRLHATFRWSARIGPDTKPNFALNYPMQANGAEMLRLACCLATESSIEVVAPVHDAMMICAPFDRLDVDVERARAAMAEASRIVLDGFELRTDVHVFWHPDRYADKRGTEMWRRAMTLLDEAEVGCAQICT
jgi:DNA polymerase I-like protein with 3'-5' exonuclease and polymerase domains